MKRFNFGTLKENSLSTMIDQRNRVKRISDDCRITDIKRGTVYKITVHPMPDILNEARATLLIAE
jgi:hypothetical protein